MSALTAYIPFLAPINAFGEWSYLMLIPLALGISMIYKAMRMQQLDRYWRQVAVMTVQIVLGMAALGLVLVLLVQVIIPLLPAE